MLSVNFSLDSNLFSFRVLVNYLNEETVQKAWIGLRAEGAETEVTWSWSNGKVLENEFLDTTEMRHINMQAANDEKLCMIVKQSNGKVRKQRKTKSSEERGIRKGMRDIS